jgi:hypothetical protein
MRIAVSGTHSVGKSTFVWDFVNKHQEFIREEEPYRALRELYPIKFGKEATNFCNGLQLFYNLSRVKQYQSPTEQVLFDRCPVDYIAYSMYAARYQQTDMDDKFVQSLITPIRESLSWLDIILFVTVNDKHPVNIENDGIRPIDPAYRNEVDGYLKEIYFNNLFQIMPEKYPPKLIELWGSREERVMKVTSLL